MKLARQEGRADDLRDEPRLLVVAVAVAVALAGVGVYADSRPDDKCVARVLPLPPAPPGKPQIVPSATPLDEHGCVAFEATPLTSGGAQSWYIASGVLLLGAAVVLLARRRVPRGQAGL
jgi:LPXTG-motif cell wall-anchored protein